MGEALTAGRSTTGQLSLEIIEVDYEDIDLLSRQDIEEVRPVESGDLRRLLLRDLTSRIPEDRRSKAHFEQEFVR